MPTTRNQEPETEGTAFTPEQESRLAEIIREAVASGTPPPPEPNKAPPVTDDEWDKMSDRQRESWVRSLVDDTLDRLAKEDADRRRDEEIDALKAKAAEPEGAPQKDEGTFWTKIQKVLWGEQK